MRRTPWRLFTISSRCPSIQLCRRPISSLIIIPVGGPIYEFVLEALQFPLHERLHFSVAGRLRLSNCGPENLISLDQTILIRHLAGTRADLERNYLFVRSHSYYPREEPVAGRRPRPRPPLRLRRRFACSADSVPFDFGSPSDSVRSAGSIVS